jgi:hypothetical protein
MTILNDYHHFEGLGWSTGYLCNALAYQGMTAPHTGKPFTEALLMGINGGICAGYFAFEYQGYDPHLHFLTRYPFDEQPGAVFERLGISMHVQQTTNPQKGVANLLNGLAHGTPVIVWGDVISLGYESHPISDDFWMVMPFLVYGYDLENGVVHIADRARVGLTTSTDGLAAARARTAKTKHRIMTIGAPNPDKLPSAVEAGIRACIQIFTEPPPFAPKAKRSFGFDAFDKWASLLTGTKEKQSWSKIFAPGARMFAGLTSAYRFLEVYFTGGRGARGVYADFLEEASLILDNAALKDVAREYRACAVLWDELTSGLLPDDLPLLREARQLMTRDYDLFLTQGNASLSERRQIGTQLEALRAEAERAFPLSDAEAAAMRLGLRERVLRLRDAEYRALSSLAEAVGVEIAQPV